MENKDLVNNLTKENFWIALYEKFPGEVQSFCDWIDAYKKRVGWNILFNSDSEYQNARGKNAPAPKYHDLPLAMQWGIFQQFCAENHPSGFGGVESTFEHPNDMGKIPDLITEYFSEMNSKNDRERSELKHEEQSSQ